MTVILWVVGAIVALLAVLLAVAATQSEDMVVTRSIDIHAPREKIFPFIDDFHNWVHWSPWDKLDPAMTREYKGPPRGVDAVYTWKGNKKVGEGEMKVTASTAPSEVVIALHFIAPWEASNTTTFTLRETGENTRVEWHMRGPSPFVVKVMRVLFNLEKAVGKDFESGLAALKVAAERP